MGSSLEEGLLLDEREHVFIHIHPTLDSGSCSCAVSIIKVQSTKISYALFFHPYIGALSFPSIQHSSLPSFLSFPRAACIRGKTQIHRRWLLLSRSSANSSLV